MDLFTKVSLSGVRKAAGKFQPTPTERIPTPRTPANPQLPFAKVEFVGAGLEVPGVDEDVPMRPWTARTLMKLLNRYAPFQDQSDAWASAEECQTELQSTLGSLLPKPDVVWADPTSDAALERWAFQGFGAQRLRRGSTIPGTPPEHANDFVVALDFMQKYPVRPGLARYGGDAWFSPQGKVKRIRLDGQDMRPGDGQRWEVAKFTFRSSSLVWTTLADHVGRCHYGVGNAVVLATRRFLGPDHGLRRFLAPFHFRTAAINNGATQSLVPWGALLHRTSGFEWEAMLQIYKDAPSEYRYETFPDALREAGVHPESFPAAQADLYPYASDGLLFWDTVHQFVATALERSPTLQAAMTTQRGQTDRWWEDLRRMINGGLPDLSLASLTDFLTHAIFMVTAFHGHVGTVTPYVTDPRFTTGKLWPNSAMSDRQSTMHLCVVACITGFRMPSLVGDFTHLMPDDAARDIAAGFRKQLSSLTEEIQARNAKRAQPVTTFLPTHMSTSVAI